MILALILLGLTAVSWIGVTAGPLLTARLKHTTEAAMQHKIFGKDGAIGSRVPAGATVSLPDLSVVGVLAVPLVLGIWAFFGILDEVAEADRLVDLDRIVFEFLRSLRTPAVDTAMIAITGLGDAKVVMPVALVALVTLAALKRQRAAIFLMLATAGAAVFVGGVKRFIHRPRPVSIYDGVAEYSFPSGHASMSIVLYGVLAMLLAQAAPAAWRRAIAFTALLVILMISFSRIYLGAHWMSDVLAGLGFGAAWIALIAMIYLRTKPAPVPFAPFAALVLVAFAVAGSYHVWADSGKEAARYAAPVGGAQGKP